MQKVPNKITADHESNGHPLSVTGATSHETFMVHTKSTTTGKPYNTSGLSIHTKAHPGMHVGLMTSPQLVTNRVVILMVLCTCDHTTYP